MYGKHLRESGVKYGDDFLSNIIGRSKRRDE
jgi:hypothetical protein